MENEKLAAVEAQVFGHKPGLFLLFFTEMWERFSYYGMRALLVLFLVNEVAAGGWAWTRESALELYAYYTGLVYLTPILGGFVADKFLGYRKAVILGALLMTLGHAALAFETKPMFYAGLGLLIFGNGFFKPNISSIVGQLYEGEGKKKDAAYTIFYMGINAGAFLGILLCGYVGEKVMWSYGFGLAGVFMLLGMIMFQFGQSIFGEVGKTPTSKLHEGLEVSRVKEPPLKESDQEEPESPVVIRDRLIVIGLLSFFTIFFWWAFEQAGGSMTIFAKDYTGRVLSGQAASIFYWSNFLLTVVPLAIVTFVLIRLFAATFSHIPFSNLAIGLSFVIIWAIAIWMLQKEYNMRSYEISFAVPAAADATDADEPTTMTRTLPSDTEMTEGETIFVVDLESKAGKGKLKKLTAAQAEEFETEFIATVVREKKNELEIPASWFGILNSFFIIAFAPLLSRLWETRLNPSAPAKFGLGLVLLGLGFGALSVGSMGIEQGAESAAVSIWWLVLAYLLHTLGELCVSPVGLSYVSKLAPAKLVGLMFGIWFLATAIANFLAGKTGSYIDPISEEYGLSFFFLIFICVLYRMSFFTK